MRLQARVVSTVHRSVIIGLVIARLERILVHFATLFTRQPRDYCACLLEPESRFAQNFERLMQVDRDVRSLRLIWRAGDDDHDLTERRRRGKDLLQLAERPAKSSLVSLGDFANHSRIARFAER